MTTSDRDDPWPPLPPAALAWTPVSDFTLTGSVGFTLLPEMISTWWDEPPGSFDVHSYDSWADKLVRFVGPLDEPDELYRVDSVDVAPDGRSVTLRMSRVPEEEPDGRSEP